MLACVTSGDSLRADIVINDTPPTSAEISHTDLAQTRAPSVSGAWDLSCARALLERGELTISSPGDALIFQNVAGSPATAADRMVFSYAPVARPETVLTGVTCDQGLQVVTIISSGNPDRPALSQDGELVAYFSGQTGMSALYLAPFTADAASTQLNNFSRDGFTPPPHRGPPTFDDSSMAVTWRSPRGAERLELP